MSSASDHEEELALVLSAKNIITEPISTLSAVFFVYGVYCVVFGLSVHALFRNGSSTHKLHRGGPIALFALATIYTIIETWGLSRQTFINFETATTKNYAPLLQYLTGDDRKTIWMGITSIISTLMNTIADAMLIHRCYIIFNSNKFILYPLVFVAFILNGIDLGCIIAAIIGSGDSSKHNNSTILEKVLSVDGGAVTCMAIFQITLTFMTGGRIWWITREARQLAVGRINHSRFSDVVAIIVESALLYASILVAVVVFDDHLWYSTQPGLMPYDFTVISVLMSGLAPTMVIARVAYGKSVDNVQQTLSRFQIADIEASIAIRQATIDLQSQTSSSIRNIQEVEMASESPVAAAEKV